jgi:hypothetical protein
LCAKEEFKNWFEKKNIVKKKNPNIKQSKKFILIGVAVYGKMHRYAEIAGLLS